MYSQEVIDYINNNLIRKDGIINPAILRRDWFKTSEIHNKILKETEWANKNDITTSVFLIRNNITEFPKCLVCDNPVKLNIKLKFSKFCSKSCSCKTTNESRLTEYKERIHKQAEEDNSPILSLDEVKSIIKNNEKPRNEQLLLYLMRLKILTSVNFYCTTPKVSYQQKIYMITNDITNPPKCQYKDCNKEVSFNETGLRFREFCCNSCKSKHMSPIIQERTLAETGYRTHAMNPINIQKHKDLLVSRYGVEYTFAIDSVKEKSKQTKIERYGDENYNNPNRRAETNIERYGHKVALLNEDIKKKSEQTCLAKYGHKVVLLNEDIKKKSKQTCLAKYGCEYPMQSGLFRNGYKWKQYKLPSGRVIPIQGYENRYIPILIKAFGEENIVFDKHLIPKIKYTFEGTERFYFPDFYVPKHNLMIEIKSTWTYNSDLDKNLAKFEATRQAGYELKVKIYK